MTRDIADPEGGFNRSRGGGGTALNLCTFWANIARGGSNRGNDCRR